MGMFSQGPSITARLVVAVLFSLLLMAVDHRQNHLESVRSTLSVVISPLRHIASLPVDASIWLSESFASRQRLYQENEALRAINFKLKGQQQKLEALETENMRLRDLLDSSLKVGEQVQIAELIAIDLDPYKQQVVISRGSSSGVFEGQAVLDADAVLGQVSHVDPLSATVLMITDPSHALPVEINRNGLRTIAVGTGLINELELPYLPNNSDIQLGDLLVTSGLGGHFPQGYPVAIVTQVTINPGQPFAKILAKPSANLERTHEVLLVRSLTALLPDGEGSNLENVTP